MNKIVIEKRSGAFSLRPLREYLSRKTDGLYTIAVKRVYSKRTNSQNAWLWGCVYPMMMEGMLDLGWEVANVEQVHELFRTRLASERIINRHTGEACDIPASTAAMDTSTFSTYCDKLREYAAEYLGVTIPDPDSDWRVTGNH